MHDIRLIRENPEGFDAGLARRGLEKQSKRILELDDKSRKTLLHLESMSAQSNTVAKSIGELMARGERQEAEKAKAEGMRLKANIPTVIDANRTVVRELEKLLESLPNIPLPEVPDGKNEAGNVEIARWPNPDPKIDPPSPSWAKEHADLGPPLGLDFETGAAIAGARFTFLKGGMARLHRALAQFMLDTQTATNGYMECAPPLLVRDEAVYGTGQLPKFADDLFWTYLKPDPIRTLEDYGLGFHDLEKKSPEELRLISEYASQLAINLPKENDRRWLIPTSEVSLTNAVREQILDESALPLRMTALTPCFRSEAGAAGKDTRGFIRQHQFEKVELVTVCTPDQAEAEHAKMLAAAEAILQALDLPYRTMLLCAGDMGATARKTYDLEVWLPGQGAYREISSVSQCGDYQARRMNARYRPLDSKKTEFVHTLNGSGLAVGRTLVAVLENYQQADGTVEVPKALAPYMGGLTRLEPLA
jgi:seryl-tRNA synthetase